MRIINQPHLSAHRPSADSLHSSCPRHCPSTKVSMAEYECQHEGGAATCRRISTTTTTTTTRTPIPDSSFDVGPSSISLKMPTENGDSQRIFQCKPKSGEYVWNCKVSDNGRTYQSGAVHGVSDKGIHTLKVENPHMIFHIDPSQTE